MKALLVSSYSPLALLQSTYLKVAQRRVLSQYPNNKILQVGLHLVLVLGRDTSRIRDERAFGIEQDLLLVFMLRQRAGLEVGVIICKVCF